jgi:hypothetical protein
MSLPMGKEESSTAVKMNFSKERLLELALDDALAISDRFAREPVLGPTGKGYYKSAGVDGLVEDLKYLETIRDEAKHSPDGSSVASEI